MTPSIALLRAHGGRRTLGSCAALCSVILLCAAAGAAAENCPAGQAPAFEGSTECLPCRPGDYQDVDENGVNKCVGCPQHSISTQEGATSCEPCAPGNATYGPGNFQCAVCDAGDQACDTPECYGCAQCPAGTYTAKPGDSPCIECPAGNYIQTDNEDTEGNKGLTCVGCPAGSYGKAGSPATRCYSGAYSLCCDICEPGTFTSTAGQTQCEACPAGTYQSERNASSCTPCAPGSYSSEPGSTTCTPASIGFYQPEQGGSKQLPCPAGTVGLVAGGITQQDTCRPYNTGRYKFTDRFFRLSIIRTDFGTTAVEATANDEAQVMDSGSSTGCSGNPYNAVTVYSCYRYPYSNGVFDKSVCSSKPGDLSAMNTDCSTYNFYALQDGSFAWVVYSGGLPRASCVLGASQTEAECKLSETVQSSTFLGEWIYFKSAQSADGQPSTNNGGVRPPSSPGSNIDNGGAPSPSPSSGSPNAATATTGANSLRSVGLAMLGALCLLFMLM